MPARRFAAPFLSFLAVPFGTRTKELIECETLSNRRAGGAHDVDM